MQALSEITQQLLQHASLAKGMRVLDIGCGSGEVTRAIAEAVGDNGEVVGIDNSYSALAAAKIASEAGNYSNISYIRSELTELPLELGIFDCIVCRRVLMYIPQAEKVIEQLVPLLRPDGCIAIQEHDTTMTPARIGNWSLHDQVHYWLWESVKREGANPQLGISLAPMLLSAGLQVEKQWAQAIFAGYESGIHHQLHDLVKMLQDRLIASGVTTEQEIDLTTLETRLKAERHSNKSSYVSDMAICVIARKRSFCFE